ncbi:2,3-diphosphoglycerate-dependent phosphoglycerate mutase [Gracilibacillus alcaliphilus]|uniref:2,3-diphosphoglycerate-dependent phosphoglycerate mutase n=1 Tax=Gracilibacillus alcaliphilus TaxID=1401441 RepID=UPI00195C1DE1|nr:2,3-diphosphoglycerate-dependent phosphoglycerate mutase [Gracilibacillus alcaliphilus]MBM7679411.1 2,3-bisphosphoglycerate-dependent phosphoglycerate mutase [Gracilibacillus alcaliphilus]
MRLVLIRHGESEWNVANLFTGWTDVDLTDKGAAEAKQAGKILKEKGFRFDIAFTSYLKRAIKTLDYVLEETDNLWIPVYKSWKLNERHYGALQGLNKEEVAKQYGEEQVLLWRRSFQTPPPSLDKIDDRYPGKELKYQELTAAELPTGESLATTIERVIPFWNHEIKPVLAERKKVIVAAHGNSLRGLVKYLENISDEDIVNLNIPTGVPLVYELDEQLVPISKYYL